MSADLKSGEDPRAVREMSGPGLESVTCHEDLVRLLAEQFARADMSLRELQARADKAGGIRLPRATCADMLAGRRFPKKAVMVAFLRACRVPEHQFPVWERAWERVRVTRMPAVAGQDRRIESTSGIEPAAQPTGPSEAGPARVANRGWRYTAALAALVSLSLLAVAVALAVIVDQRGAPQHVASEAPGRPVDHGRIVTDDGRAFGRGGLSRFTVTVDPANTGVRLIRRLDVGVALQHATITVNGVPAGKWEPLLGDSTYKWRDQSVDIRPPALTAGRHSLTIVNTFVSSSLGFNEFLYVIKQKVNGVWSTADRVDIGPNHTASEAAHDYHIIGGIEEPWGGTQTFAYPPLEERKAE